VDLAACIDGSETVATAEQDIGLAGLVGLVEREALHRARRADDDVADAIAVDVARRSDAATGIGAHVGAADHEAHCRRQVR
jgi:hypothetical protein